MILKEKLTPNSLGNIKLREFIGYLKEDFKKYYLDGNLIYESCYNDIFLRIVIYESIIINVNLLHQQIAQISVLNFFKGDFEGIKIGSTLAELKTKFPDILYDDDEDFYFTSQYPHIVFSFEAPYSHHDENKIEEITINAKELNIIPLPKKQI